MLFNFKNKNIKIILLILLVLASVACYSMIRRDVEGLTNISSHFEKNFKIYTKDFKNGMDYYFLEPYSNNETDINFTTDTPLTSLNATYVSKEDVNKNGGIYKYMFKNGYDMYRLTKTDTGVESYEVYNIDIPFSINLLDASSVTTASVLANPVQESVFVKPAEESTITNETPLDDNRLDMIAPPVSLAQQTELNRLAVLDNSPVPPIVPETKITTTFLIAVSSIVAVKQEKLKVLISERASTSGTAIEPSKITLTIVPPIGDIVDTSLKIDILVPESKAVAIISQLQASIFSSIQYFNADMKSLGMSEITAIEITIPIGIENAPLNEGFGNMFSYLFGKNVKEGNTGMNALTYKGNILFRVKEGDYSKVLRKSRETMDITIKKSKNLLIQNGALLVKPQNYVAPPDTDTSNNNTNGGDGNCTSCNSCLIPGSDPALVTNNKSPFYADTSMFETAMQNPSNPIVNPVNSLNPIQYSQTLFSPSVQPVMANTACSSTENNDVPTATVPSVVGDVNNINAPNVPNNINAPNVPNNINAPNVPNNINAPNVPNNIFNDINNVGERMLAQNGNSNIETDTKFSELQGANNMNVGTGIGGMKKNNNILSEYNPNINDGNNQVPRPVLANFSTFGS
jgi:hypothetical protein